MTMSHKNEEKNIDKKIDIWKLLSTSLKSNVPSALLYVLESQGSSPGRQGFFMAVNSEGEMEGSIGGGVMEHRFVDQAKGLLFQKSKERKTFDPKVQRQIHAKNAPEEFQSGMICSGEQTIFLHLVRPEESTSITAIINDLEKQQGGILKLSASGLTYEPFSQLETGDLDRGLGVNQDFLFHNPGDAHWYYKERLGYKNKLFIIGGGHCSLAFSRLMSTMDFYISLYDDRPGLNTMAENSFVHEKMVLKNYHELKELIPSDPRNYIVVMTFGYKTDDVAVRALLEKDFKYFGLLGSRKKIDQLFNEYINEGIDPNLLRQIHAPIGIPIKSKSTEEIAVSIAAEIIKVKNSIASNL